MNEDRDRAPRLATGIKPIIGRTLLKVAGWRLSGNPPQTKKYVIIAAPHTSNWDLIFLLACAYAYGIDVSWMGKRSIFKFPFGGLMRALGGISVDRSGPQNTVQQIVQVFDEKEALILAVPPSGTRSRRPYWKTGFYHIAHSAGVPIATSFLDYGTREAGFGHAIEPTGDIVADFERLRQFYGRCKGKFPENTNDIKLKDS